ncbi:proteinral transcription repressor [Rhodotorula sphaerocarpa]
MATARAYEHRPLGAVSLAAQPVAAAASPQQQAAAASGSAGGGARGSTPQPQSTQPQSQAQAQPRSQLGTPGGAGGAGAGAGAGSSAASDSSPHQAGLAPQPPIHPPVQPQPQSQPQPQPQPSSHHPHAPPPLAHHAHSHSHSHAHAHSHSQSQSHAHAHSLAQPHPQQHHPQHPHAPPPGLVVAPNGMVHSGPGSAPAQPQPGTAAAAAAAAAQAQAQAQAQAAAVGPGGAGAGAPGQGQPQAVVVPHPSAQRLNDLLEFVKAEFEQVAGEGGILRAQREEYEAMIHSHASELNAMRAMVYDLERKYHDDKRLLQDETIRLQEENLRLRHQLDTSRASASSQPPLSASSGRPVLPPMTAPLPSLTRPASGNAFFPPPRAGTTEGDRDRMAEGSQHPQNGSDYPNKRMRGSGAADEDERKKTAAGGAVGPEPTSPVAGTPAALGSSTSGPMTPAPAPATAVKEEKVGATGPPEPSATPAPSFDPETAPKDLKKEGSDWMTMFNPNVKRVLDVGLVHTLVHDSVVCCVRFSPDGKALATGCNRNTTLYDTKTGARIAILFDESSNAKADNYIRSVSFSPDGKYLATGSEDRIVRIWNIAQKRILQVFQGHKSEIYSLTFSPDGRRLMSGSGDKTARMWDLETGTCVFTLTIDDITIAENGPVDAGVTSVVFSPDGKFLAAGSLDTVVRIWDAETGQLLDKLKGHMDSVYSVAFSPDGRYLVSGSLDKTLKMFDIGSLRNALAAGGRDAPVGEGGKTKCLTTLQGHKDYVLSVDISPDGAWIVSGSKDRGVQFWDPKTAKAQFMLQGHKNSVISVAVSNAGGMIATGSGDWSARIWSYERIA